MSKVKEKAYAARHLKDSETFKAIVEEIKGRQIKLFLDAGSSIDTREQAHVIIRALNEVEREIDARLADAAFEEHKEQHRDKHD